MLKEIRTVKITEKGQIVIPKIIRISAGFKEGSKVSLIAYEDRVELKLMNPEKLDDALFCMLASEEVLTKNWLSKKDEEAWKDL